jgi:hypothetical protein
LTRAHEHALSVSVPVSASVTRSRSLFVSCSTLLRLRARRDERAGSAAHGRAAVHGLAAEQRLGPATTGPLRRAASPPPPPALLRPRYCTKPFTRTRTCRAPTYVLCICVARWELTPRSCACLLLPLCRDVHADDQGGGRERRGGAPGAGGAGVVAAHVPQPLRGLPPLPPRPRRHPARPELPARVLPGGLALQVRQQALHALIEPLTRQRRRHLSLLRTP